MRKRLTDRFLQTVAPPSSGRDVYSDTEGAGLELRVSAPDRYGRVAKSWSIRYTPKRGARARYSYGTYPKVSLTEARARAREIAAAAARGIDLPATEDREEDERRRAAARPQSMTELFNRYVEEHCKPRLRRWKPVARTLEMYAKPAFGDLAPIEFRRADLVELLDNLQNRRGFTAQVNRAREYVIAAVNWACEREFLDANPAARVKKRKIEAPRNRVLSDAELRAIWRAVDAVPDPARALVKVLILTGQRRDEVRCLPWGEVDLDQALWTLPASRNKGKRDHEIPLTDAVVELLGAPGSRNAPVFTLDGQKPFNSMVFLKGALDRASGVTGWVYHDIRRTVATNLAALRIPQDVIDRTLGHAQHAQPSLAGTYNRHAYLDEKRRALEMWARRLAVITGDNVVELRAGA